VDEHRTTARLIDEDADLRSNLAALGPAALQEPRDYSRGRSRCETRWHGPWSDVPPPSLLPS
jgi:hypothetical protein